ncbi:MAG: transglycosylase SLT domain-containing protein [Muribaculaceae bacterium]|nr:transglycosylase SLT domain-containing protein [Muribaculaceae bacterium]
MKIFRSHIISRLLWLVAAASAILPVSCKRTAPAKSSPDNDMPSMIIADTDSTDEILTDTIYAVTLYGPTSYFIYKGEAMGYDYSLLKEFAAYSHKALKLNIAPSLSSAVDMLRDGKAQLLAYNVPITAHYRDLVLHCGPESYSTQVLVQPKVKGEPGISDVTQLVGKDVYVIDDSKYLRRLQNLSEELAAEISIHPVNPDSATAEDLIALVSQGEIPFTVVDSDIARLNETYFHDLDISVELSTPQRSSWAVAPRNTALAAQVNDWFANEEQTADNADLLKRYFEMSKSEPYRTFDFSKGYISKYDNLFKKYSDNIDWDWRLLAAQAYAESLFNPKARSWVGARGLMQVMPRTGRGYGASVASLNNPDVSVKVATRLIADLNRYLINLVPNDKERRKFIIAAYNCGIAHIYDAIALAEKHGLDPQKWDDNVEKALLMKMNPQYYNDPVVKYGYARGSETSAYVKRIMEFYDNAVREIDK